MAIVCQEPPFLETAVFRKVTSGMDTVDKIAALRTNSTDAPVDIQRAKMIKVAIGD
jgi:cyclophilin family peptidyl-prolyl cis-trans isomerase